MEQNFDIKVLHLLVGFWRGCSGLFEFYSNEKKYGNDYNQNNKGLQANKPIK